MVHPQYLMLMTIDLICLHHLPEPRIEFQNQSATLIRKRHIKKNYFRIIYFYSVALEKKRVPFTCSSRMKIIPHALIETSECTRWKYVMNVLLMQSRLWFA